MTSTASASRCATVTAMRDDADASDASNGMRRALAASALALFVVAAGVEDAAATDRGTEVLSQTARASSELTLEDLPVVGEVIKDEEIAMNAVREGRTAGEALDLFLEKEPPLAVGVAAMLVINGSFGLVYTLFVRETSVGPGGEFGKAIVALRQSVVKGIFAFFNSSLGRYTTKDSRDA